MTHVMDFVTLVMMGSWIATMLCACFWLVLIGVKIVVEEIYR